jgi:hypothetical protein
MSKRKIFDELVECIAAMKNHRERKITLRTYKVQAAPLPSVVDSGHAKEAALFTGCFRPEVEDQ